jgi:hypothetical protein
MICSRATEDVSSGRWPPGPLLVSVPRGPVRLWAPGLAILLLVATAAGADSSIDGIEHLFGATNINAVTGNGRIAVGVSQDGDVSVLTWPSPSYCDQLAYLSSNDVHARALARLGAPEGAGIFIGLVVQHRDGSRIVTWLRDRTQWEIEQSYGEADGPNVTTRHVNADLGLTVSVVDAVQPAGGPADVYVRSVTVERAAAADVTAAWLLTYANLSPTPPNSRVPEIPIVDWVLDGSNDYAAVWDASFSAIVHFHPNDQLIYRQAGDLVLSPPVNYGVIGETLRAGTPDARVLADLAASLDTGYAAGSYVLLTTRPAPDQHQIGYDATPLCAARDSLADNILDLPNRFPGTALPLDPNLVNVFRCRPGPSAQVRENWTHSATDALIDAADGDLEGSGIAAGEVNEALRTPLGFAGSEDGGSRATATVVLALGSRATEARAAVQALADPTTVLQAAADDLAAWEANLHLPDSAPAQVRAVARRSLINLRVGTDLATGAIVASIARQPPYGLDWPRDGTFFSAALNISGQSDLAARRAGLYADWQRKMAIRPTPLVDQPPPPDPLTGQTHTYPADSWEMNYYPDGMVGGPIRFEIDNSALALWSIVSQAGWTDAPAQYLAMHWDTIERGVELLARWRDPQTGLQAPASEDDNTAYTRGLHGAVTVYGALDVAARAARLLGHGTEARGWERRACELREAIGTYLYDAEAMRFVGSVGASFTPASAPTGETAWMVWPSHVLSWDDVTIDTQLAADADIIAPTIRLETQGGSYFMKSTVSLGLARGRDVRLGPTIAMFRDLLAERHATTTGHFGEAMIVVPGTNGPIASQRVATPHLWEGILFYLTAMALDAPQRFDQQEVVLPPSQVPPPGGCARLSPCTGDCNDDGSVTVDEIITSIGIVLGETSPNACIAFGAPGSAISVEQVITAVGHALNGCGA